MNTAEKSTLFSYIDSLLGISVKATKKVAELQVEQETSGKDASKSTGILNVLLADIEVLKVKLLGFHWNVEGPHFIEYHEHFEEMWDDFHGYSDLVAEQIRQLEAYAATTMQEFLKEARIKETTKKGTEELHKELEGDFKELSDNLQKDIEALGDLNDFTTQDILVEIKRDVDKKLWFIRSINK